MTSDGLPHPRNRIKSVWTEITNLLTKETWEFCLGTCKITKNRSRGRVSIGGRHVVNIPEYTLEYLWGDKWYTQEFDNLDQLYTWSHSKGFPSPLWYAFNGNKQEIAEMLIRLHDND